MISRILIRLELIILSLLIGIFISGSNLVVSNQNDNIRLFTRASEFDYFDWTLDALGIKISQAAISTPLYFDKKNQHQIVMDYLKLTDEIIQEENQIKLIFSDPGIIDPDKESLEKQTHLEELYQAQNRVAPFAEAVLEKQVSEVLQSEGLTFLGFPFPPVLFHISPLPFNIVISPRNKIEQSNSISLRTDLPVDEQVSLEQTIDKNLNVSSLVVPVGGIGSYPTMIELSTSLDWISNTIAHEWTHNWLSLQPLGLRYSLNNQLRTMNETTASIVGDEIGKIVISKFYPELISESLYYQVINLPAGRPDPRDLPLVQFDFRSEMHKTRVEVDQLLALEKIDSAENYMEARRKIFWENGYAIRKLNQAYFAFYGAYADVPGGAAGEDPVGPAVRALRAKSQTLRDFLETIATMTSFEHLTAEIGQ